MAKNYRHLQHSSTIIKNSLYRAYDKGYEDARNDFEKPRACVPIIVSTPEGKKYEGYLDESRLILNLQPITMEYAISIGWEIEKEEIQEGK